MLFNGDSIELIEYIMSHIMFRYHICENNIFFFFL